MVDFEETSKKWRQRPTIVPFEKLKEGRFEFGDSEEEFSKLPPWFDLEMARKGQKFADNHRYAIAHSHMMALFFVFTNKNIRNVILFAEKSDSYDKALKRYFATILQVQLWYLSEITEDLDCPFFTSLKNVRAMHRHVAYQLEKKIPDFRHPLWKDVEEEQEQEEAKRGKGRKRKPRVKRFWRAVKSDVEYSFPDYPHKIPVGEEESSHDNQPAQYFFSQFDMTLVQWAFLLILHFPEKCGLFNASDEDLNSFLHLWALIGHVLGMNPGYNLCIGSTIQDFRKYSKRIFEEIFLPGMFHVNYDVEILWQYMAGSLATLFPITSYEFLMLQFAEDFVGVENAKNVKKLCTWDTSFRRFAQKFVVYPLLKHTSWMDQVFKDYVTKMNLKWSLKYFKLDPLDFKKVSQSVFYPQISQRRR